MSSSGVSGLSFFSGVPLLLSILRILLSSAQVLHQLFRHQSFVTLAKVVYGCCNSVWVWSELILANGLTDTNHPIICGSCKIRIKDWFVYVVGHVIQLLFGMLVQANIWSWPGISTIIKVSARSNMWVTVGLGVSWNQLRCYYNLSLSFMKS